jgi:serine/threonine protein kinase
MSLAFDEPDLRTLVQEQIDRWRSSGRGDAAAFLDEHPELRRAKSLVLDLIHEDYCLRREAGHEVNKSHFCDRFPSYRQSVFRMLEVEEYLDQRPGFATKLDESQWPVPGQHFMGFDLVELLGCGALARVFLAREPALGNRPVVVKISQHGGSEAEMLGKLPHPGIVPIHSVLHDEVTGWTVICMPLIGTATGVDLLDAAFEGRQRAVNGSIVYRVAQTASPRAAELGTPPREDPKAWRGTYADAISRIGWQLAEALEAAHTQGVLHHDIKPSNVLLAWSGRPMLLDFNLSTDKGVAGERIGGTPAYMAPEAIAALMQQGGTPCQEFDPRGDIFSLGAVLFELLTGRLPARPENADRLPPTAYQPWLDSKQSPPPEMSQLTPAIDPRLEAIVRKCLASNPADRYATAGELAQDLKAYLGITAKVQRWVKRHWRPALVAYLLGFALAASGGYYLTARPPYHERLLAKGLAQYGRDEYSEAALTFSECLEKKPDFPAARFARGQTYRRLREWNKARDDFLALEDFHEAWAYGLAGECNIDREDNVGARSDMLHAYIAGLRNIRFLLNYANVSRKAGAHLDAIKAYDDVLQLDRDNSTALCNRALTQMGGAMKVNVIPVDQAFEDIRQYCRLNPNSFESHYSAAKLFGYAAKRDAKYRAEGEQYLLVALERGLPRELVEQQGSLLKPLLNAESEDLFKKARSKEPGYSYSYFERQPPPTNADWTSFLREIEGGASVGKVSH